MKHKLWLPLSVLCSAVLLNSHLSGQAPDSRDRNRPGPAVGTSISSWTAPGSTGALSSLQAVLGRRGALLTFLRSAEW